MRVRVLASSLSRVLFSSPAVTAKGHFPYSLAVLCVHFALPFMCCTASRKDSMPFVEVVLRPAAASNAGDTSASPAEALASHRRVEVGLGTAWFTMRRDDHRR